MGNCLPSTYASVTLPHYQSTDLTDSGRRESVTMLYYYTVQVLGDICGWVIYVGFLRVVIFLFDIHVGLLEDFI